ncbi:uncharacterized protein SAPINGB_P001219 [Magnusiomyces paraingens]|uniref:MATE efflux family protein n=1 Tax=Magnusiomyces paraingens TaxID=2606893 RepID=A0A5E8B4L6_9ASCO|nr:uncharacterized protein SAPINGB_P001219 [Saprochaete ingens]VVT46449.1 unnamed protein product [Saprochaete ingens]
MYESDCASIFESEPVNKLWNNDFKTPKLTTVYFKEIKYILVNAGPLILTLLVQNTLTIASIFFVGHLGKSYLAAVSLASMTANITGMAFIQGLATCLDTLCAQAYHSKSFKDVGEYVQKCILMILLCFSPIGVLWYYSQPLFSFIAPKDDPFVSYLAAEYLRVALLGIPGYICFECGKRLLQAQGLHYLSSHVLFICAPINLVLTYILVWYPGISVGYIGSAISISITQWLMAFLLFGFSWYSYGFKNWISFSKKIFQGWSLMIKHSCTNLVMIEMEIFAFEVFIFCASLLGSAEIVTQSIMFATSSTFYQISLAISIIASHQISCYLAASSPKNAQVAKNCYLVLSVFVGLIIGLIIYFARYAIVSVFSDDDDVKDLFVKTASALAFMAFADAPCAVLSGILRGLGRSYICGYLNLFFYYFQALPLTVLLSFQWGLGIAGFSISMGIALLLIGICELVCVQMINLSLLVEQIQSFRVI